MSPIVLLTVLVFSLCSGQIFPSDRVQRCAFSDSNCIQRTIQKILSQDFRGIPGLFLPSIDPLHVETVAIHQGAESPVNIKLDFRNLDVIGIKDVQVTRARGFGAPPVDGQRIELQFQGRKIDLKGQYSINGRVLVLPIQGAGQSLISFENVAIGVRFVAKSVQRGGREFMQIDKIRVSLEPNRLRMNFEGLFNGDKVLGDNMNEFLNQHWSDIYPELRVSIENTFAGVIKGVLNGIFQRIPYDELFLK